MTDDGTNIEFDFFEEPETREATRSRPRMRRPGGTRPPRRPRRGPTAPAGLTPLLRLAGLIGFAIVLVVLLAVWVDSCRAEGKRETYRSYMAAMATIAEDSAGVGRELNTALTTPGTSVADLQETLGGLADQQELDEARAREVEPPGRLREQHGEAVEALELRSAGLRQLVEAFRAVASSSPGNAGATLAPPMRRLLASDVIWEDQFLISSTSVMERQDVRGVEVPDSNFLTNYDLATERLLSQIWQRVAGAAGEGAPAPGRHGNGLVQVRALPAGQVLQLGQDNFVVAGANLAFEVMIENSGENQEVGVEIVLTIEQSPQPIEKTAEIQIINPGERKVAVFRNLGQIVQFAQKTTVRAEIQPVEGEENIENNSASYSVTFTLTPP
ncbi:MAG: hypothetical protein WD689_11855 [Gaiellaceae bacterium]